MEKEELIEYADYYINNNVTMEEASKYFKVSKKTYIKRLNAVSIAYPNIYKLVEEKKKRNLYIGRLIKTKKSEIENEKGIKRK